MKKNTQNSKNWSNEQLREQLTKNLPEDCFIEKITVYPETTESSKKPITKKLLEEIYNFIIDNNIELDKLYLNGDPSSEALSIYIYQDFESLVWIDLEIYNEDEERLYDTLYLLLKKEKNGQSPLKIYHDELLEILKKEHAYILKSKYDDIYIVIDL